MDELGVDHQAVEHQYYDQPGIGIDATAQDTDPGAIVATVDRVTEYNAPTIVAVPSDAPSLHRRLTETGAALVTVRSDEDAIQAIVTAAKHRGLPGVITHPAVDADTSFEYDASRRRFYETDDYVVPGAAGETEEGIQKEIETETGPTRGDVTTADSDADPSLHLILPDSPEDDPWVDVATIRDATRDLAVTTDLTLDATPEVVLEQLLTAHRAGTEVFVAVPEDCDAPLICETLGARAYPLPETSSDRALADALERLTQLCTAPYLIIPPSPSASTSVALPTSPTDPEVLVGIPAYNEAGTIADVVTGAAQHADEVLVVDDASSDSTADRARDAGATVVQHTENNGYGGALNTIFDEAARRNADHLVIIDGDGQHDPSDIPAAVATQRDTEAEIVIGSRYESTGSDAQLPLYRRAGLAVVNTLTNLSLGVASKESWVKDTQSGFRTYTNDAVQKLSRDDTIGDGMSASTDILYHAHHNGYDVEEIGANISYDVADPSSHNPVAHGLTLVANILKTIERDRPVTTLGIPGFISTLGGIGFGYWTFARYITTGTFPLGLAVTSSFFALAGIFACFTAIILHSLNTHLNQS